MKGTSFTSSGSSGANHAHELTKLIQADYLRSKPGFGLGYMPQPGAAT